MKKHILLVLLTALFANYSLGQQSVLEARNAGVGAVVTTKGLVTNGAELGVIRYFQDNSGGIAMYDANYASAVNRGDSILITGTLVDYNGLLEISSVSSLQVLNSGNPIPDPLITSIPDIGEQTEGELVRINQVSFTNAGGTFSGNTTYQINAGGQSINVYIRTGSPLVGTVIPGGIIDLVGISSQFILSYQLLPRDANDFISGPGINITSAVTQTGLSNIGFTLNWTTDLPGSTEVRYGLTPELEMGVQSNTTLLTNHSFPLFGVESGQIYYCQAFSVANGDTAYAPVRPFGVVSLSSGQMIAYFNTSVDTSVALQTDAVQLYEAIDDTLIAYLNRAQQSIDLTIYDFDNNGITNISEAINAAYNRGVAVRFISDGSLQPTNFGIGELLPEVAHLYSPTGDAYNIMHNKFVIIDANHSDPLKPIVWTGSTNWTDRQINRDNNSVIIIQDQTLARAYTMEFNEMWGSTGMIPDSTASKFGSFKTDNTPHDFIVGGKKVECYFSPSDNVNTQILNTIAEADSNAYFASMLITRNDLAQALVDLDIAGAEVKGIINDISTTTQYTLLSSQLTPSNLFVNPDTTVIMHHKYLITDHNENGSDPQLWVGSHNWSTNANTRNDENSLVIHDANLVNQYYQEFTSRISAPPISGCINASACNFNPAATIADSSCLFIASACDDLNPNTINDVVNFSCACVGQQISLGCTDVSACNFSSSANTDDGSCVFINDPCDDGNPLTQNDSIAANCNCEGIVSHIQETNTSSLAIFPNPCNDLATIQWFSQTGGPAVIRVYDAIGKTQESYQTTASSGLNLQQVNVQRFAKGRYELVISNGAQVLRSVLIIE